MGTVAGPGQSQPGHRDQSHRRVPHKSHAWAQAAPFPQILEPNRTPLFLEQMLICNAEASLVDGFPLSL